jgi:hypothetical protein
MLTVEQALGRASWMVATQANAFAAYAKQEPTVADMGTSAARCVLQDLATEGDLETVLKALAAFGAPATLEEYAALVNARRKTKALEDVT